VKQKRKSLIITFGKKSKPEAPMAITLGRGWQRHTMEKPGYEYLGTVQWAAQLGALAKTPEGEYVQINGGWALQLSTEQVREALRSAEAKRTARPRNSRGPAPSEHTNATSPRQRAENAAPLQLDFPTPQQSTAGQAASQPFTESPARGVTVVLKKSRRRSITEPATSS
jgi:hypothetical protein